MRQKLHGLYKRCCCPRRGWLKCSHGWHFAFKWRETHHRFSLDRHFGRHIHSKTEAEEEAERIRTAIRDGHFGAPAPRQEMTLRQLADVYVERYVLVERPAREDAFKLAIDTICRTPVPRPTGAPGALGEWRLTDIITDSVERFREARRALGTGIVGTNRLLGSLRALLNWGVRVGYLEHSPFKRGTEPVVKLSAEPSRSRRLCGDEDEEDRLLAACGPHLRAVVEAALETGMRRGEILSLQWSQVEGMTIARDSTVTWTPRAELVLPWTKTKTRRDRRIPISSRLRAVLEMRRFDPAGKPFAGDRYVFGNGIGQRVRDVGRAWETAVLRAHGHTPTHTATANLTPDLRAALASIDLHFHDLRREAGSRWLEGGVPLHTIRDWLGHTSIAQTSVYLSGTMRTQHDAMRAFEERRLDVQRRATGSRKRGRKPPRPAATRETWTNKTGVHRERPTM